jgi:hypothetical protein
LRPSDILIERFQGWKQITKNLIAYFEGEPKRCTDVVWTPLIEQPFRLSGIADIESNTARELTKLGGVIQVPFRAGNQFLGEGGMQDIFYGIVSLGATLYCVTV